MNPETTKHCLDLLREGDRERYLAVLFAPEAARPALAALHAFNLEVARIRDVVSEPMPGEIRLQWWREVVGGEREGEARAHPVAAALREAMDDHGFSPTALVGLTEARIFDLYDDPMPDRATLEGYLGETASSLFQLSSIILAPEAAGAASEASGHAGVAYGIAGLLRLAPLHRSRGQVYVPADVLAAAGTDRESWLKGDDPAATARALTILATLARDHLASAEGALGGLDKRLRPAFLPLAVVEPVLRRVEKAGADAASRPVNLSPLTLNWLYLRRAMRG